MIMRMRLDRSTTGRRASGRITAAPTDASRGVALPPIFVERSKQAAHDLEHTTQRIVEALEGLVRRDPDQWYIFRPMWPERGQTA